MNAKDRTVACPNCGRPAAYDAGNRWRPFCSERCRAADFGAWASERFRIVETPAPGEAPPAADGTPPAEH